MGRNKRGNKRTLSNIKEKENVILEQIFNKVEYTSHFILFIYMHSLKEYFTKCLFIIFLSILK